jgi:hypothetical protein
MNPDSFHMIDKEKLGCDIEYLNDAEKERRIFRNRQLKGNTH